MKSCIVFLFLISGINGLAAQKTKSITLSLEELTSHALKASDTTQLLLDKLRPRIEFDFKNDQAFEFLLIEYLYSFRSNKRDKLLEALAEAKKYYTQSSNPKLRSWYELASSYHLDLFLDLAIREKKLKDCIEQAELLGYPNLIAEGNRFLALEYRKNGDRIHAECHFNEALKTATDNNLNVAKADILYSYAVFHLRNSEYDKANKKFAASKKIYQYEGHENKVSFIEMYEADILRMKGFYAKALEKYQKVLEYFEKHNLNHRVAMGYKSIGTLLQNMDRTEEAIDKFKLGLTYVTKDRNPLLFANLNAKLGSANTTIGHYDKAEKHLKIGAVILNSLNNDFNLRSCYNNLGDLYLEKEKYSEAEFYYNNAIERSKNLALNTSLERSYLGLSKILFNQEKFTEAQRQGEKALDFARKNQAIEIEYETLILLSKMAINSEDYKKGSKYQTLSMALQDSVLNFKTVATVANLMSGYENKENQLEILRLKFENQNKEREIKENNFRSNLYLGIFLLIAFSFVLFLRNYFKNKSTNVQLEKLNTSLNQSNQKLNRSIQKLNQSNQKLLRSNKELNYFAHVTSNDLKSPLRTITSFSHLLKKSAYEKLAEKEIEYLDLIELSGRNLAHTIDDVLSYSNVGAQQIALSKSDLNVMMKNLLTSLSGQADEKSILLDQLNEFPQAVVDEVKLRRVFQNIILNALEFYDEKKDKKYIKFSYKDLPKFHQFTITDNGIGIENFHDSIDESSSSRDKQSGYEGFRMRLDLCSEIIEKHEGEIWYESELGKGTTFHFTVKKL